MNKPNILIFSGYGLNCEEETKFAFELAGAKADIIHINDLMGKKSLINNYQIMALPGGFCYGDDTGSGNAYALKMKNHLWEAINDFILKDKLVIGICNGFQILVNLGLLPALDKKYGEREVALLHNDSSRYIVRWVDLTIKNHTPWFKGIKQISLPIAHGEGKFYAPDTVMKELKNKSLIAAKYYKGEICRHLSLPANPNGALENIAAITDESGKILGMMPHPERAVKFTHLPHWTYLKEKYLRLKKSVPKYGSGLQIFQNAINYFT